MAPTLEKPKVSRVRVVIYDLETNQSKSVTIYGATVGGMVTAIKNIAGGKNQRQQPQTSAA